MTNHQRFFELAHAEDKSLVEKTECDVAAKSSRTYEAHQDIVSKHIQAHTHRSSYVKRPNKKMLSRLCRQMTALQKSRPKLGYPDKPQPAQPSLETESNAMQLQHDGPGTDVLPCTAHHLDYDSGLYTDGLFSEQQVKAPDTDANYQNSSLDFDAAVLDAALCAARYRTAKTEKQNQKSRQHPIVIDNDDAKENILPIVPTEDIG
jgi:hypothetical protein